MQQREDEPDMPEIAVDKVCFIVAKSRELLAEDAGVGSDASNPTDDGASYVLTESADRPNRRELRGFMAALDVDEVDALMALAWIGRGDFEAADWRAAVSEAAGQREARRAGTLFDELLEMPVLPDYLEDALSAFDRSCSGFDARDGGAT